jgi:hypothetical protein
MVPARVWKIYVITSPSGKQYVGQTVRTIKERWEGHCVPNSGCAKLRNAIKKYGKSAFIVEHVLSCGVKEHADEMEQRIISERGSAEHGYNITRGGAGNCRRFCPAGHDMDLPNARVGKGTCRVCARRRTADFRDKNRDTVRARDRERYHENGGIERARRQRASNPESVDKAQRAFRERHRKRLNRDARARTRRARLKAVFQDFSMGVFRG